MRLASVGRMVPVAGRPLPALCFLALWHVSGTYIMWLTIWILSVFQIQSSLCFPISSTRQGIFVVFWTYIASWDVFLNANLSSDFMSLRCSAALCTSSRIRKLFSAKSKKWLAFTDSLLQLSWSDISAGRSASIPRMLCFLGNGSTPHAIDVQFFLVRSTKYTRRQERLTEQANAAPTSVLEMLKLHKIYWLLPVEELEKGNLTQLGLELPTARISLITKH